MEPEPFLEIHPEDADPRGIQDGDLVLVSSRRGAVKVRARVTDRIARGTTFLAMHWGDLFDAETAANYLTLSALDPISKEPEFKHCAVAVERWAPPPGEAAIPWPVARPRWRSLLIPTG